MHFLAAAFCAALASAVFNFLFQSVIFSRYRLHTPATWRVASRRNFGLAILGDVIFGVAFAGFFEITGGIGRMNVREWVRMGVYFGAGAWVAIAMPLLFTISVVVNFHRGVLTGALLSWLCACTAAGVISAFFLLPS